MKTNSIFLTATMFALISCSDDNMPETSGNPGNPDESTDDRGWLIPFAEVRDGGPGKDGIPAINTPVFIPAAEATYLNDNDLSNKNC